MALLKDIGKRSPIEEWFKDFEPDAYAHYVAWCEEKYDEFNWYVDSYQEAGYTREDFPEYANKLMEYIYGKYR